MRGSLNDADLEAIEKLKIAKAEIEWEYPIDYQTALDTAIEALEKQIPQKPKIEECPGWFKGREYYCPRCGTSLATDHNDPYENWWMQFCNECGQRIDLEGVE